MVWWKWEGGQCQFLKKKVRPRAQLTSSSSPGSSDTYSQLIGFKVSEHYHPRRIREVRGTQLSDPRFPVVLYTLRSPKGAAVTCNKTLVHDFRGTETFSSVTKAKIFVHRLDQCGWWQMVTSSSKSDRISACDLTIQSPMWQPQH